MGEEKPEVQQWRRSSRVGALIQGGGRSLGEGMLADPADPADRGLPSVILLGVLSTPLANVLLIHSVYSVSLPPSLFSFDLYI